MISPPPNWTRASLGEICSLVNGRAFKTTEWSTVGLPIIRIQNLNSSTAQFNRFSGPVDARHLVQDGDLLFAWSGTPGTSFGAHLWNRGPAVLNQHIFKVIFNRNLLNPSYLKFAINETLEELIEQAHGGVGLRHLTKGTLEKTEILLPPFGEQCRIAEILTSHLDRIAAARADLRSASVMATQFKSSVLARAFGIKSSTPTELLQFARLIDLVDEGPSNGWSPKTGPDAKGALSLKLTATTSGQLRLDENATKRIYDTPPADSRYWLSPGDLLIQRANALEHLGAAAIFDGPPGTYIYPDLMMRVRINDPEKRRYIWRYLNSDSAREYVRSRATGTAGNMPKINGDTVRNLPVPIPTSGDFKHTLETIDRNFEVIEGMIAATDEAANLLDSLEKMILERGLSGQLVAPDPEDGVASDLLLALTTDLRTVLPNSASEAQGFKKPAPAKTKKETQMGNKVRLDVPVDHLCKTLTQLGGSAASNELWRRSEMTIDEFYKQLRKEIADGRLYVGTDGNLVVKNAS